MTDTAIEKPAGPTLQITVRLEHPLLARIDRILAAQPIPAGRTALIKAAIERMLDETETPTKAGGKRAA